MDLRIGEPFWFSKFPKFLGNKEDKMYHISYISKTGDIKTFKHKKYSYLTIDKQRKLKEQGYEFYMTIYIPEKYNYFLKRG